LDAEIRDRTPSLNNKQKEEVRILVSGFLRKASDDYSLFDYIDWREQQNIKKKKKVSKI
jgi:hypothetical protein